MLAAQHNAYLRVRNRRVFRTIIYSTCTGVLFWWSVSGIHGFTVGATTALVTMLYYTIKLERQCRASQIGG